jgi:hypothetical protein
MPWRKICMPEAQHPSAARFDKGGSGLIKNKAIKKQKEKTK